MILDSFYLLFKTDSNEAIKGVDDIDKKIDQLTQKGKKRSEEENKELKELIKQRRELNENLKETDNQYTKIGQSLALALTSALSFGAVAKGIFDTAATNSDLEIQSKLLGQNVVDLKAYGQAVKTLGGTAGGFGAYIQKVFEDFSSKGLPLPSIDAFIQKQRDILKKAGNNTQQQQFLFGQLGITDQGYKNLLLLTDKAFDDFIAKQKELAANTQAGAEIARKFESSWTDVGNALNSVFTAVGNDILPEFESLNRDVVKFLDNLKDNIPSTAEDIKLLTEGIGTLAGLILLSFVPALAAMAAEGATVLAIFAPLLALVDTAKNGQQSFLGKESRKFARFISGLSSTDSDLADYLKGAPETSKPKKPGESISSSIAPLSDNPIIAAQIALRQGQQALNNASQIPINAGGGGNKNININTGDIHVNTNATSASGIANDLSSELSRHLKAAVANIDDGVNY